MPSPSPISNEFLIIRNPSNGRELLLGSTITPIENIDDLLTGPGMRGSDTPNIYLPGSMPGSRITTSAEYNVSFTVLGTTDFNGDVFPGSTEAERLRMNLEWVKAFAYTPYIYTREQMLQLRWYGKNPFGSFVMAFVHINPEIQIQMIGKTAAKVTINFVNPFGYWVSDWNVVSQEFVAGYLTHTMTVNTPSNIAFSEFYIEASGPINELQINRGYDNWKVAIGEAPYTGLTPFNNLMIDMRYQTVIDWTNTPTYTETNVTGKVVTNNPRWMIAEPYNNNDFTVVLISNSGTGTKTVDLYYRNCYV